MLKRLPPVLLDSGPKILVATIAPPIIPPPFRIATSLTHIGFTGRAGVYVDTEVSSFAEIGRTQPLLSG